MATMRSDKRPVQMVNERGRLVKCVVCKKPVSMGDASNIGSDNPAVMFKPGKYYHFMCGDSFSHHLRDAVLECVRYGGLCVSVSRVEHNSIPREDRLRDVYCDIDRKTAMRLCRDTINPDIWIQYGMSSEHPGRRVWLTPEQLGNNALWETVRLDDLKKRKKSQKR